LLAGRVDTIGVGCQSSTFASYAFALTATSSATLSGVGGSDDAERRFRTAIGRLVDRVAHWTPTRWARPAREFAGSRADAVHALAQRLADAGADAEGGRRRPVPRLDNDLALPDQVRVLAADVLAAAPAAEVFAELTAAVREAARQLD
jgi:hypothetical protein